MIRAIGVLALSGIGAAGVAWVYVRSGPAPVPAAAAERVAVAPAQTVSVLVAARDLKPGDVVKAADIVSARRPKAGLPPGAILSATAHFGGITGRVVRHPLVQGAVFDPQDLQAAPSVDAALLARGMRGISIAVTPQSAVAGLLTRGDYVDVLLAYKTASGQEASRRILQGLLVLATDQDTAVTGKPSGSPPKTVTLQVTPEGAKMVALAQRVGTLSLALSRAPLAGAPESVRYDAPVTVQDLTGSTAAEAGPAPAPTGRTSPPVRARAWSAADVQIVRGAGVARMTPAVTSGTGKGGG